MILTTRQQEVLDFIDHAVATAGVMPSTREIQEHFGFASQTAALNHLRALEKKGVIQRQPGKARAVAVVAHLRRETIIDVPIYGSIAAGYAETAQQEDEGVVSIDSATLGLGREKRVFALKVRGDSMVGADIHEGDLVVLENREPRSGVVVAALIDGETTLKRLVQQRGRYFLKAENPKYPDLIPLGDLQVQGVMVALIRKFRNLSRSPRMVALVIEFSCVVGWFLWLHRRQVRDRARARRLVRRQLWLALEEKN